MALPNTKVEIAFNAGYTTAAGSRTWTDVSTYVLADSSIRISRGRQDEISQIQPSTCTITLDNADGRFTPEKTAGAYYPNVKKGRPIRVTSTYNAVTYVRFVGYVNEWPLVWPDSTDSAATVTITASSRLARMGASATLQTIMATEIQTDTPTAWWPLSDPEGSTRAVDISGNGRDLSIYAPIPPGPTFGVTQSPGSSSSTAVKFTSGQLTLGTSAGLTAGTTPGFVVAFSTLDPDLAGIFQVDGNCSILMDTGALQIGTTPVGVGLYNDGSPHAVGVQFTSASTADVYIDGTLTNSGVPVGLASPTRVTVGLGGDTIIAQAAFWSNAPAGSRFASYTAAIPSGYAGDLSGARIARYAYLGGVPSGEMSIDTGTVTIAAIDSLDRTPVDLMQSVATAENGILYDAKDATGSFVFKDRDHRYNLASSFTLSATTQEIQGDLLPRLDDQFLVNDFTATGAGVEARVVDVTSVNEYGYYRQSIDVPVSNALDSAALAAWRVGLNKQPTTRYPTVSVDVTNLSTSQAALVLAAEISTRFGLSGLPAQAPATTADLFIEGYSEVITSAAHSLTFNTSPATGYAGAAGVWQLDVNNIDGPYILAL